MLNDPPPPLSGTTLSPHPAREAVGSSWQLFRGRPAKPSRLAGQRDPHHPDPLAGARVVPKRSARASQWRCAAVGSKLGLSGTANPWAAG